METQSENGHFVLARNIFPGHFLFYITILSFLFFPTLSIYVNIFLLLRPLQEKLQHHHKHLVPSVYLMLVLSTMEKPGRAESEERLALVSQSDSTAFAALLRVNVSIPILRSLQWFSDPIAGFTTAKIFLKINFTVKTPFRFSKISKLEPFRQWRFGVIIMSQAIVLTKQNQHVFLLGPCS